MAFMSLLISVLLFYACYVLVKRHDGGVIDFNWMLSKKTNIKYYFDIIFAKRHHSHFIFE